MPVDSTRPGLKIRSVKSTSAVPHSADAVRLDGVLARDDRGFILTGPDLRGVCGWTLDRPPHHLETSVPGVFATGDVRAESAQRVAAAVGEGSMAVMLVHRYLAES